MNKLDQQLQRVQEFDPITVAVVGSAWVIASLVTLLYTSSSLIRHIKIDQKLSKRLNKILGSGDKWKVHVYKTKDPNAFSLGFGVHVFVTSKLLEMLSPRQVDAVLLHEVWHSKAKHVPKQLAFMYPLYYLVIATAFSAVDASGFLRLGILAVLLFKFAGKSVWNILFSQKHEIHADEYATKLGYGKELAESLKIIEKFVEKYTERGYCGKICQLIEKLNSAIAEHPSTKKRIEIILRKANELDKALKSGSFGKIKNFVVKAWGK